MESPEQYVPGINELLVSAVTYPAYSVSSEDNWVTYGCELL